MRPGRLPLDDPLEQQARARLREPTAQPQPPAWGGQHDATPSWQQQAEKQWQRADQPVAS